MRAREGIELTRSTILDTLDRWKREGMDPEVIVYSHGGTHYNLEGLFEEVKAWTPAAEAFAEVVHAAALDYIANLKL
jgi:hypothetical protein